MSLRANPSPWAVVTTLGKIQEAAVLVSYCKPPAGRGGDRLYQTFENLENKIHVTAFTDPSLATTDLAQPPHFLGSMGPF